MMCPWFYIKLAIGCCNRMWPGKFLFFRTLHQASTLRMLAIAVSLGLLVLTSAQSIGFGKCPKNVKVQQDFDITKVGISYCGIAHHGICIDVGVITNCQVSMQNCSEYADESDRKTFIFRLWVLTECTFPGPDLLKTSKIAKALGSMSIWYRSDTFASDRYPIDIDPRVFAIRDVNHTFGNMKLCIRCK